MNDLFKLLQEKKLRPLTYFYGRQIFFVQKY